MFIGKLGRLAKEVVSKYSGDGVDQSSTNGGQVNESVEAWGDVTDKEETIPKIAEFEGCKGYFNPQAGWAEARRATEIGIKRVERELGGGRRLLGW